MYPEHEKLKVVREKSQACGEFLEWLLSTKGYRLVDENDYTITASMEALLAEHFEIDRKKIDAEKDDMLEAMRRGGQ